MSTLTLEEKCAKVRFYQRTPVAHELTCGFDSKHEPLLPRVEGDSIVLYCIESKCEYRQVMTDNLLKTILTMVEAHEASQEANSAAAKFRKAAARVRHKGRSAD